MKKCGDVMKISVGDFLAVVSDTEEVSIVDVYDGKKVYIGTAQDIPMGLKKWTVGCVSGNDKCGLSLYGAHPCIRECI